MPKSVESFAVTTASSEMSAVFDDALRSLRIGGSLLLRESYSPPWAIAIPTADQLAALLGTRPGVHVVAFHLVEFGHCSLSVAGGDEILLTAGELAICFGGAAHRLSVGKAVKAQPVEALLTGGWNLQRPGCADRQAATALLCGVFMLHHTPFNPLVSVLPSVLRVSLSRSGELHNLAGVARLLTEEIDRQAPGSSYVAERLLEALCAEAMRAHIEASPQRGANWLCGIKDPLISRAIAAIHSQPGADWTVQRLASNVAMSPSRFAARFSAALGDSPMAYATKWRMHVACRELAATLQSVEQVAANVGYDSLAAFSRTFEKHVGIPPAAWRARERQSG